MHRWIPVVLIVALVLFAVASLLAGGAIWAVPVLLLLGLVALMAGGQWLLRQHVRSVDGETSLPATHVEAGDDRPLGDSPELHDHISPHDLPKGHPGRVEAERREDSRRD